MKASLLNKLTQMVYRHTELGSMLSDAQIIKDQSRFVALSREFAALAPIVADFQARQLLLETLESTEQLVKESEDPEFTQMAKEELADLKAQQITLEAQLKTRLIPQDPNDTRNIFLEIRAGTGGDEASIFAGDLFRMYHRYADNQGLAG